MAMSSCLVVLLATLYMSYNVAAQSTCTSYISDLTDLEEKIIEILDNQSFTCRRMQGRGLNITSCDDLYDEGLTIDGYYKITLNGVQRQIYCDFDDVGTNWLVFQKRWDGSVNFCRNLANYTEGFGSETTEFWLGLDTLHDLTSMATYMLRIDLEDFDGNIVHAEYSTFQVGSAASNYILTVGGYNGTAGDSFSYHNNQMFSTMDSDHDMSPDNCAGKYKGGWWYNACHDSNLNGVYFYGGMERSTGVTWYRWKNNLYSVKGTQMKMKLMS